MSEVIIAYRRRVRAALRADDDPRVRHDCVLVLHLTKAQRAWLEQKRRNQTNGRHGMGWYMRRLLIARMVGEEKV